MKKKTKRVILLSVLLLACGVVYAPAAIPSLLKIRLRETFPGSSVSVGQCIFSSFDRITVKDLRIYRKDAYSLEAGEAGVQFGLSSLLRGRIPRVFLKDAEVRYTPVETPGAVNPGFPFRKQAAGDKGFFQVEEIELSRLHIEIKSRDFAAEAYVSLTYSLSGKRLMRLEQSVDYAQYAGVRLKGMSLYARQGESDGRVYIRSLRYNKLRLGQIEGTVDLRENSFIMERLKGSILGGRFKGEAQLALQQPVTYSCKLRLEGMDMVRFVREFELAEKMRVTGRLGGDIRVKGEGVKLQTLSGKLSAEHEGGTLVIRDTRFLENMASRSARGAQALLVESLRNYRYNKGTVNLGLEKGNIAGKIALDGEAGKRDFTVVFHEIVP